MSAPTLRDDLIDLLERHGVPRDGILGIEVGQNFALVERHVGHTATGEPVYATHHIPLTHVASRPAPPDLELERLVEALRDAVRSPRRRPLHHIRPLNLVANPATGRLERSW